MKLPRCCEPPHKDRAAASIRSGASAFRAGAALRVTTMRVELDLPAQRPVQQVMGGWVIVSVIALAALIVLACR